MFLRFLIILTYYAFSLLIKYMSLKCGIRFKFIYHG